METRPRGAGPAPSRRRARVVLRASGKRRQIAVSEGSETCESASEAEGQAGGLSATTHYDHSALDWTAHTPPRTRHRGRGRGEGLQYEALNDTISSDVFREKLEFSGRILHSTPHHTHSPHPPIQYPMPPGGVSSSFFHDHQSCDSHDSGSSDNDGEDSVFLNRPRTAPVHRHRPRVKVKVHPEPQAHNMDITTLSSSLPPLPKTMSPSFTSPQSTSSDASPLHPNQAHGPHRRRGRWAWGNTGMTSPTNLHSTSSSNALSTNSFASSTIAPLLTSRLRKGGRRPSVDTHWDTSGEEQLESCVPDRHIRVFVTTWNMHEEKVSILSATLEPPSTFLCTSRSCQSVWTTSSFLSPTNWLRICT